MPLTSASRRNEGGGRDDVGNLPGTIHSGFRVGRAKLSTTAHLHGRSRQMRPEPRREKVVGSGFWVSERLKILVSAAGLEPATHALKGSPTQLQTITCTSSLLHARHNKINEMPTRHRSGCPEGARNPASRTMSLRFIGSFVTRRIRFAEPSSIRLFSGLAYFVV